eukprot:TRINITY_DN5251_c0_g1_i1.p1 TRINITY_DN5251_c0_g1~~TRINITY_DN5251_c0_g1_i1.p1  ORF type:complete len:513 (+),score=130.91 TRINITY_DN5251_c0_g1_i1:22-1560(+)
MILLRRTRKLKIRNYRTTRKSISLALTPKPLFSIKTPKYQSYRWYSTLEQDILNDEKESIEYYRTAAEDGDAESQYQLALIYDKGEGVPQDKEVAKQWYLKAADQGHTESEYMVGSIYLNGGFDDQIDYRAAYEWFKKAAAKDHSEAQVNLGFLYLNGSGIERNMIQAKRWIKRAMDLDNEYALGMMAEIYEMEGDIQKAIELHKKSAENGNSLSQYHLGQKYIYGNGVSMDIEKGMQYMNTAALTGSSEAQFFLGNHFENIGDLTEAEQWYKKSAGNNHAKAMLNLGLSYYVKGRGVKHDEKEGVTLIRKAAERGDPRAQIVLADFYFTGKGVSRKNEVLARQWYSLAADQGELVALENYGMFLLRGIGGEINIGKAKEVLEKAAEQGSDKAEKNLKLIGDGVVSKDGIEKTRWIQFLHQQADKGDPETQRMLGMMYIRGDEVPQNHSRARQLFISAAENGDLQGQMFLGVMLGQGKGGSVDLKGSKYWLRKASNGGSVEAKETMKKLGWD